MAIIERPHFDGSDWEPNLPPGTLIKRATSFSAGENVYDPPATPDRISWEWDDDFTTVEIETVDE
ncbi:MAG: hypothetical protein V4530_00330 [Pseudomonadota bacterium]